MDFQPVDLNTLVAVVMGTSIVLIPVLGATLRFAVKPLIEAWGRAVPGQARLQAELERLTRRVQELEEAHADRQLAAPGTLAVREPIAEADELRTP